jgi:uncharacterized protein YjgD (DUF1641 family)
MNQIKESDSVNESNNLDNLVELSSAISSAQDAMTDDIVTRLAAAIGEGMILMDRLTRNEGLMSLMQALNEPAMQEMLERLGSSLGTSADDQENQDARRVGGYSGLIRMLKDPDVQSAIYQLAGLVNKVNNPSSTDKA